MHCIMAENKELERPEVGHEVRDVNAWAIGRFAIGLILLCIVAVSLLFGLFHYFLSMEGGKESAGLRVPPAPTLEVTPIRDLQAFRTQEDQILSSYGWVDQSKGIVRIPIDKAIDLL